MKHHRLDSMARKSCGVVMTAAALGSPEIILFNDLEHRVIKVAHIRDCRPYVIGDYATLDDAAAQFEAAYRAFTRLPLEQRPAAGWYKDAVRMLMHLDLAHVFRSRIVEGPTRAIPYTVVYIDGIWRLTNPSGIWGSVNSELL